MDAKFLPAECPSYCQHSTVKAITTKINRCTVSTKKVPAIFERLLPRNCLACGFNKLTKSEAQSDWQLL